MTVNWIPEEGALVAASLNPQNVAKSLADMGVVAELDWYPNTAHLLGLTVLIDENEKVAVVGEQQTSLQAGMDLAEVTEKLAEQFHAEVWIGNTSADKVPEGTSFPDLEKSKQGEVRVVEITKMPAASVPFIAAAEGLDVGSVELGEGMRAVIYAGTEEDVVSGVMVSELPAIALYASNDDHRLAGVEAPTEQRDHIPSESLLLHSWQMNTTLVVGSWNDQAPAGLLAAVRAHFGEDQMAARLAEINPLADRDDVDRALATSGTEGFKKMVAALGLPDFLGDYLDGDVQVADLPDVAVFEASSWGSALGSSVDIMLDKPEESGSKLWSAYHTAALDKPWIVRAWAGIEATAGTALLVTAFRSKGRKSGWLKAGAGIGTALVLDSLAQLGLSGYLKQRKKRHEGR